MDRVENTTEMVKDLKKSHTFYPGTIVKVFWGVDPPSEISRV